MDEGELSEDLDRGGSYSPYLSPHEVEQSVKNQELPPENPQKQAGGISHLSQAQTAHFSAPKSLSQARKQAQDSILRLWPLNVRYQDYLNEGVDPSVLQDLFRDLGLDFMAPSSKSMQMSEATPDSDVQHPTSVSNLGSENKPKETTLSATEPTQASDPNEERKDRIARLLAAKSTKPTAIPPEAAAKAPSPLPTPTSVSTKSLSEKSKLLQRKMEALERARWAQRSGQERSQSRGAVGDTQNGSPAVHSETAVVPLPGQAQAPPQNDRTQSSPPIPGLFLSPAQQPSSTSQQKRPVAVDFNDASEAPLKRPFGQSRQTQPFLIHVSDDEDDEAMDLDSPELRPVSTNRPGSPFKIPSYRDLHTAPANHMERQLSTPMPTPPTAYSGRGDLETMNKEIEAMKRKIAEAEAKKKAKLSTPASPAVGPADRAQSVGSAGSGTPLTSTEDPVTQGGSPQLTVELKLQRLPKVSETRRSGQADGGRSRSRAASERLPIIEARRREKLMKLQELQSQVQMMEKEIEDSLLEEKMLKEEAVAGSNSDEDEDMESSSSRSAAARNPPAVLPQLTSTSLHEDQKQPSACSTDKTPAHNELESAAAPDGDVALPTTAVGEPMVVRPDEHFENVDVAEQETAPPVEPVYTPALEGQHAAVTGNVAPGKTPDEGEDDESDGYEPPEAESSTSNEESEGPSFNASPSGEIPSAEGSDVEVQGVQDSPPAGGPNAPNSKSGFVSYESPLKYFRAYRFHPRFSDAVPGGLRSLTYSNKIDVKKELCPDQLAGTICPRGQQCEFQHFEAMQAPDDQILLQLGAYGNYEGEHKQEYINGLRQLLTNFRNRKIKDFKTISQGIIDYRAQFRKDPSKILPLGNVSI
ncbi:hypothetical protein ACO1O0_005340 [Amphichorda felina]